MRKKCIMKYVVCYGLALIALAFYLYTLYIGVHPHPSMEYRSYYLDQELIHWPGLNGLEIIPGQAVDFSSEAVGPGLAAGHVMRLENGGPAGWSYVEKQGLCITQQQASLLFRGQSNSTYHVLITFAPVETGGEIVISVNGEQMISSGLSDTECTIEFDTPVLPADGRLQMDFQLGEEVATPVGVRGMTIQ